MSNTKIPEGLNDAGRELWKSYGELVLRPDERVHLRNACRTADMIAALESRWVEQGCPDVTTGSMGQEVIHPLIGELRMQKDALDRAIARIKLVDDVSDAPQESSSDKARRAAMARWSKGA